MSDLYLGIDTSNYKTSVAVTDAQNNVVFERSEYLEVPRGKRGLRQSEAFFRHSCRLPQYIREVCAEVSVSDIRSAGVSTRPRRVEGSYMPCFLAGSNAAGEISAVLGIPLHEFSHQEGHAAAIIENDASQPPSCSLLMHLSGGTTEILVCRPDDRGYDMTIAGGTGDISIGQLIDRAGVAMGFDFPSGMYLDNIAQKHPHIRPGLKKIRISDGSFNLSGTETQVMRLIQDSSAEDYPFIAYSIFYRIAELLAGAVCEAASAYLADTVYMAGGVASSGFIRLVLPEMIYSFSGNKAKIPEIIFGEPFLSGDNAVGIARLARRIHMTHS